MESRQSSIGQKWGVGGLDTVEVGMEVASLRMDWLAHYSHNSIFIQMINFILYTTFSFYSKYFFLFAISNVLLLYFT